MTVTYSTGFDQLLDSQSQPPLGYKFLVSTSSAAATATSTDPELIQLGTNQSSDRFNGRFLWIPSAAAAADQVRTVAVGGLSVSAAGVATFTFTTTANFGETLSNVVAYLLPVHPDLYMNYANDALKKLRIDCPYPLMHGPADGFMEKSDDTDWTETNATDAKQSTASEVLWGPRSLVVTDSGSGGGYTQSALDRVGQGESVMFHAIAKADTGTSALDILDGSGNEQHSLEFTQESWLYMRRLVQFDATDEEFRIRLEGVTASAVADWQAAWYVKQGETSFILPSWIDHRNSIKAISKANFRLSGRDADTWLAGSMTLDSRLQENDDYVFFDWQAGANPNILQVLKPHLLQDALFVVVSCPASAPYGVDATFTSYSGTNPIDIDLLVAAWQIEVARGLNAVSGYSSSGDPIHDGEPFTGLYSKGNKELSRILTPRTTSRPPYARWPGPTAGAI